jgi:hypothetical protein
MAGYNERCKQHAWKGLEQKMSLLKQRFEGMFLTIDSVK